jgi:hypothetical protein
MGGRYCSRLVQQEGKTVSKQGFTYWQKVKIGYRRNRGLKAYPKFVGELLGHAKNDAGMILCGLALTFAGVFWLAIRLLRIVLSPILYPVLPLFRPALYKNPRIWERLDELTRPNND